MPAPGHCRGVADTHCRAWNIEPAVNAVASSSVESPMTFLRRSARGRVPMLLAAAALCLLGLLSTFVSSAGAQRGRDSGDAAASAEDVDVLSASREQVRAQVDSIQKRYSEQRQVVDDAQRGVTAAEDAVSRAQERVSRARVDVEAARLVVRDYAVEAYVRPPAQDALRVLSVSRADDASYASDVIQILTEERHQVVATLVDKQAVADREQAAADDAARNAEERADAAELELVELDRARAEQQDLADGLDRRLDAALAEAASLAAVDEQLANELVAEELALREAGPPSNVDRVSAAGESEDAAATQVVGAEDRDPSVTPAAAGTPSPPSSPSGSASSPTRPSNPAVRPAPAVPAPPRPTSTRPPAPPTTRPAPPPPPRPPGGVTWSDVTNVGGIYVHRSIASNLRSLLNAATAAGLNLRGGGYRDPASQVATRRQNCGSSYYDIYQRPASQCRPPTAIPGRSMHEQGRAIDFTSNGSLIRSRSDPAFIWLRANASRYGFFNLPVEPWHWSTNGS